MASQIHATVKAKLIDLGWMLKAGTADNSTLISASSSIKNNSCERESELHHAKKENQWYFR
jgi:IS5 family transposase